MCLDSLGRARLTQNKLNETTLCFIKRALDIWVELQGTDGVSTSTSYHNLGAFYAMKQQYKEAKVYFLEAYRVHTKINGEGSPETLVTKEALDRCDVAIAQSASLLNKK